jgi:hypothetical protein
VHYEDDASAVFNFGNTLINLLKRTEAPGLIGPAEVGGPTPDHEFSSRSTSRTSMPFARGWPRGE